MFAEGFREGAEVLVADEERDLADAMRARRQPYSVTMNGQRVTTFQNQIPDRGLPASAYVGLQTHTGNVAFRNIRITAL